MDKHLEFLQCNETQVTCSSQTTAFVRSCWLCGCFVQRIKILNDADTNDLHCSCKMLQIATLRSSNNWSKASRGRFVFNRSHTLIKQIIFKSGSFFYLYFLFLKKEPVAAPRRSSGVSQSVSSATLTSQQCFNGGRVRIAACTVRQWLRKRRRRTWSHLVTHCQRRLCKPGKEPTAGGRQFSPEMAVTDLIFVSICHSVSFAGMSSFCCSKKD